MGVLSWFKKNSKEDSKDNYVLMLYLAQDTLYAYAFNVHETTRQTTVHKESLDSHLHDLADKSDILIEKCEKELGGKQVYLHKTVFVIHSVYLTDGQSPKEDVRSAIKKVCKELDLENLGYVSSIELLAPHYGPKYEQWAYAEESQYGFVLYHMERTRIVQEERIQAGNERIRILEEVRTRSGELPLVLWIQGPVLDQSSLEPVSYVDTNELSTFFKTVYSVQKTDTLPTESLPVVVASQVTTQFPPAPGFGETAIKEPEKKHSEPIHFSVNNKLKIGILVGSIFVLLLLIGSVFAFHSADVSIVTEKENFSTTIPVEENKSNLKEFSGSFSVQASRDATGEKVIGEKAKGEVTVYNRSLQEKSIPAGTKFTSSNGVAFVSNDAIKIASASGVPIQDGSKSVSVLASSVGPEGNISKNTKLISSSFPESDIYAVSTGEFSGGFKKTVIVLSQADKTALQKSALAKAQEEVKQQFRKEKTSDYVLLTDTFSPSDEKENFSADVGEETRNGTLDYSGKYTTQYIPGNELQSLVKKEKLKDKEFVEGSFRVEKIVKKDGEYLAYVAGKVQTSFNKALLASEIAGKSTGKAQEVLGATRAITDNKIAIKPVPLPFLPFDSKKIRIVMVDSL